MRRKTELLVDFEHILDSSRLEACLTRLLTLCFEGVFSQTRFEVGFFRVGVFVFEAIRKNSHLRVDFRVVEGLPCLLFLLLLLVLDWPLVGRIFVFGDDWDFLDFERLVLALQAVVF